MPEKYTPSSEEMDQASSFLLADDELSMNSLSRQMNLEGHSAHTDIILAGDQRPDLTYHANGKNLEIIDRNGKVIDTVSIGPEALNYLSKQIKTEQRYLDRLLEIKERIERDLKK